MGTGGLIPAHAGKTREPGKARSQARAHPRACGENTGVFSVYYYAAGSSPRMRGKPAQSSAAPPPPRLIPAHAGKTCSLTAMVFALRAHPRACGENDEESIGPPSLIGSSPRMRGKQHLRIRDGVPDGLIPAHAGKTSDAMSNAREMWAHPRACGENQCFWRLG